MFQSPANRRLVVFPAFFIALVLNFTNAVAQVSDAELVPADSNQIELTVPAVGGIVQWKDIAASLAEALQLDPPSVQQMLPGGQIDLRSDAVLLMLMGINLAAGDAIHFDLVRDDQNQPALCVTCDRRMFGAAEETDRREAGIELDHDWKARSTDRPLVICLHGLQSRHGVFDQLRAHLRNKGYATAAVSYDYNQSITESAGQLASIARQLFKDSPGRPRLAVIGHSMGGLVAREWTENETLGADRVDALITVGTPHRGSNWASLPPLLDLFTSGDFNGQDLLDVILHQPSAPGLKDLVPGSDFLNRLAARPRRGNVAYTNIIGTGSPIDAETVLGIRETLQRLDQDGSVVRLIRPRIAPLLGSFDELQRGKGDGVVAVERAMLDGVDNVVTVDVSHFEMIRPTGRRGVHPVWQTIVASLEAVRTR